MAVVLMSLAAVRTRQVFIKPPDSLREFTSMPRALVQFHLDEAVIDLKGATDQEELVVAMDLDQEFAYRLVDFNASLTQDTANDWTATCYLELSSAHRATPAALGNRHPLTMNDTTRVPQGGEMWIARPLDRHAMPTYIIQSSAPASPTVITFKATNQNTAAAAAGTFSMYAAFLEFDLEQVQRFPVHWPQPIYDR